jgi:diguanylate cyclase (GGDEF)-like protein/PAS domain S-box-containing protein
LAWAALALFMLPEQPGPGQVLAPIAMAALLAGALGTLAISSAAFYALVAPQLAALMIAFFLRGGPTYGALGLLCLVYLVFLGSLQRQIKNHLVEIVQARSRNEQLIAQLRQAETTLKGALDQQQLIFDLASVGIAEIRNRVIVRANAHFELMLGYGPGELDGQSTRVFYTSEEQYVASGTSLYTGLAKGIPYEGDFVMQRKDGSRLWAHFVARPIDPADQSRGIICVYSDITARKEREAEIRRLAHHDSLTGLPNRRLLDDRLQQVLAHANRRGHIVALLLVDLDGFKRINDGHGHRVGDEVLVSVAGRLAAGVRQSDTVCRLGGDEFVVLLNDVNEAQDAGAVAQKLIQRVSEPLPVGERTFHIGASIGIGLFPHNAADGESLLRCADAAMYRAKESGRGTWRFYAPPSDIPKSA